MVIPLRPYFLIDSGPEGHESNENMDRKERT